MMSWCEYKAKFMLKIQMIIINNWFPSIHLHILKKYSYVEENQLRSWFIKLYKTTLLSCKWRTDLVSRVMSHVSRVWFMNAYQIKHCTVATSLLITFCMHKTCMHKTVLLQVITYSCILPQVIMYSVVYCGILLSLIVWLLIWLSGVFNFLEK